jgi:hypothetical protein
MKIDQKFLLKFVHHVVGPAFLVIGLLLALFLIESGALPLAKAVLADGVSPEFGFVAIKVLAALAVAYLGLLMIKVKKVTRKTSDK